MGPIFDKVAKLGNATREAYNPGLWLILQDVLKTGLPKVSLPRLMTYIDYEIYNCLAKLFSFEGKSCPGGDTPCSGNGQCDPTTGFCNCQEGHQGSDCSGNKNFTVKLITTILLMTSLQSFDKLTF